VEYSAHASRATSGLRPDSRAAIWSSSALVNVLLLGAVVTAIIAVIVLWQLDGWAYYTTPLRVRGYHHAHALLRPSGSVAHWCGVCGVLMMFVPLVYQVRKRWKRLRRWGSLKTWLEVHIFCGVVGPVLVTVHTAFRFNGIISVAYWSMALVVLSGFVGRYLYVRIPKTIRGTELGYDEIVDQATELKTRLIEMRLPSVVFDRLDAFERAVVPEPHGSTLAGHLSNQLRARRGLHRLERQLRAAGVEAHLVGEVVRLSSERAALLARLAYLHQTKRLFGAWHVFHQPLVYVMFGIAALHVGVALYLGYAPW
jgi:hypothetical protein